MQVQLFVSLCDALRSLGNNLHSYQDDILAHQGKG